MNKLVYKSTIIFTCLFLLISPFSIFADEIENDNQEPVAIDSNSGTTDNSNFEIDTSNFATTDDIEDLQNQINDTNDNVESILPLLSTVSPQLLTRCTTFNSLNSFQLQYLYDHWNDNNIYGIYNCNLEIFHIDTKYDDYVYCRNYDFIYSYDNNLVYYNRERYISLSDNYNENIELLKYNDLNNSYELTPYKLNILNNGLGTYTNSISSEPYLSTNIYYTNQIISLTYNDSNNDFTGWYDNNGNLLSNNTTYTFNITSDTNLVINFNQSQNQKQDNTLLVLVCTMILFLFFIGGKVYD